MVPLHKMSCPVPKRNKSNYQTKEKNTIRAALCNEPGGK